ncbi:MULTISPECIES: DUF6461 domain-containing protein [unclassified Streptomyces]|uniref:DUF6461 domain-containing protein n=1 Tax=unclassified Streptomyces TaxID=2593676 RepID=UPI003722EA7E
MTKTGADYAWLEVDVPGIAEPHCFSLVRGLSPAELMSRLEGWPEAPLQGIAAVVDATFRPGMTWRTGTGSWSP